MKLQHGIVVLWALIVSSKAFLNVHRRYSNHFKTVELRDSSAVPPEMWFDQKLDHFDPTDLRFWKQRYYVNEEHFDEKRSGPVFLMIGGEGEASAKWMVEGQWIEYAKRFKALCFQLEHRFYGKSWPTSDSSVKNLTFLTSEQALADLANFITSMNDQYKLGSGVKWIVFGGSYPGSLAAWMRLKYPHLVHGAVSSSGPLLAKVDFGEYYQVVVDALRTSSDKCVEDVKQSFRQLDVLMQHRVGQRGIASRFRLCESIEGGTDLDFASFYEAIVSNFAGVVQYNKDNRVGKLSNITIDIVCRIMTDDASGKEIHRLAVLNSMLLDASDEKCLDHKYDASVNKIRNDTRDDTKSERQWMFQTCNEFGFYQTTTATSDIFTNKVPVDFFIQQCQDIFGKKFNAEYLEKATRRTNMMYGALGIEVSRTVFVHGSIDPWHPLGITKTQDNGAPAIYIEGTAHCANMYPASPNDLPDLKAARQEISELISSWLEL